ncbi:MAG: hypothetical protein AABZ61_04980 [Bacteroidota bacterium]
MEVKQRVINAYTLFLSDEINLLETDANERSITHQFAVYLEEEFLQYDVDCEYNRNGLHQKKLLNFKKHIESDDAEGTTVYPDIIVHHRNTDDNFIVVEAKKTSNKIVHQPDSQCACDLCKLRAYKAELGYRHAFLVKFPVGEELRNFKKEGEMSEYVIEMD